MLANQVKTANHALLGNSIQQTNYQFKNKLNEKGIPINIMQEYQAAETRSNRRVGHAMTDRHSPSSYPGFDVDVVVLIRDGNTAD